MGDGETTFESDPYLHHVHPKNHSYISYNLYKEFKVFVRYDSEGLRIGEKKQNPGNSIPYRIAFMGDSFTEGRQVAYQDSFVGLLETRAGERAIVKNYGVDGYSPAIYYLQYKKIIRKFSPTHIFLLLYSNDISDDKRFIAKGLFNEKRELLAIPGPKFNEFEKFISKFYLLKAIKKISAKINLLLEKDYPLYENTGFICEQSPEILALTGNYLCNLSKMVIADGGQIFLLAVPSKYQFSDFEQNRNDNPFHQIVEKWALKEKIPYINLSKSFSRRSNRKDLFFERDIHFNRDGHKVVAEVITNNFPNIFSIPQRLKNKY